MSNIINIGRQDHDNTVDIFVLRILAKKIFKSIPMFYSTESGILKPVDICIRNGFLPDIFESKVAAILFEDSRKLDTLIKMDASTDILLNTNRTIMEQICSLRPRDNDAVKCIDRIDVILLKCTGDGSICCNSLTVKVIFKIFLLVRYMSNKIAAVLMPDDEGIKFCFGSNIIFPAKYNYCGIKETLDVDRINKWFILDMSIPLSSFDSILYSDILNDPALQSKSTINNIVSVYDILTPCTCGNISGTRTAIDIKVDMIDRIGINQDILLKGSTDILI